LVQVVAQEEAGLMDWPAATLEAERVVASVVVVMVVAMEAARVAAVKEAEKVAGARAVAKEAKVV